MKKFDCRIVPLSNCFTVELCHCRIMSLSNCVTVEWWGSLFSDLHTGPTDPEVFFLNAHQNLSHICHAPFFAIAPFCCYYWRKTKTKNWTTLFRTRFAYLYTDPTDSAVFFLDAQRNLRHICHAQF